MKKPIFSLITGIIAVFALLIVFGCVTPPQTSDSPGEGSDIWSLLARGDSQARDFFISEIDINAMDPNGKTPLHYAAEREDAQLAAFFISLGANPNVTDHSFQSPLGISIEKENARIAEILVNAKADIHLPLRDTTAALMALSADENILRAVINADTIESSDSQGRSILHLAAISGNTEAVKIILSLANTAQLNKRDIYNKNALDYALEKSNSKSHLETAEQLILSGGRSDNPVFNYFAPAVRTGNYNFRTDGLAPIHYAVMDNNGALVSFLVDKKCDINIKTPSGAAALHEAARMGNTAIVRQLLANGADVNARDAKGNSALHTGIPLPVHREIITLLLNSGADPNLRDEHGETPLHIAIILNRPADVIQALLGGGSDVYTRNIEGKTPLYLAVQERRAALIPLLLSYGSEVFAADNSGITPFELAAKTNDDIFYSLITEDTVLQRDSEGNTLLHAVLNNRGNTSQISRILSSRPLIDARNRAGDTALHIAVRTNQKENAEFLIARGADIFSVNSHGESPLHTALFAPDGQREWIINPNTITARDGLGNTILHHAASWSLDSIIPFIIRSGISAGEQNVAGETPLFMAIRNDSPSTIRVLVQNNANLNARDTFGNSALHAAVRWNAIESAAFLLASGIDINVHSLNGNTPLHEAVSLGMSEIETLLIREGADLEARNNEGNTPFMEAVRTAMLPSIEKLAQSAANISTRNIRGDTPLHIAVGAGRLDIINILLRYGASIHAHNTRNRTPFQISLGISAQITSALLAGNRINQSDDFGNSALHIALNERVSADITRAIINQGARINSIDSNGRTPLRLAVELGLWDSVKILADSGADPFISAADNKTPADISFEKGDECIKAIFSGRAINSRDISQNTILHLAARHGSPGIINTLLELGANKALRNISSETPYDIAIRWNRRDNAELLRL